jgi:hypothetical protein
VAAIPLFVLACSDSQSDRDASDEDIDPMDGAGDSVADLPSDPVAEETDGPWVNPRVTYCAGGEVPQFSTEPWTVDIQVIAERDCFIEFDTAMAYIDSEERLRETLDFDGLCANPNDDEVVAQVDFENEWVAALSRFGQRGCEIEGQGVQPLLTIDGAPVILASFLQPAIPGVSCSDVETCAEAFGYTYWVTFPKDEVQALLCMTEEEACYVEE